MARPKSIDRTKQNLQPRTAPDSPGLTQNNSQAVSVRLHKDDVARLDALNGDRSYHIRQAIQEYLEKYADNP